MGVSLRLLWASEIPIMANKKLSIRQNNEVMDAFNLFDADKDNRINSDEILSLIKSLGGHTECKHVQDLVRACEINNGSLDRDEFLINWSLFKQKLDEEDEEEASKCMDEMDLDKDGKVSYAEFVLRWRVS